jgi:hypothetical protein
MRKRTQPLDDGSRQRWQGVICNHKLNIFTKKGLFRQEKQMLYCENCGKTQSLGIKPDLKKISRGLNKGKTKIPLLVFFIALFVMGILSMVVSSLIFYNQGVRDQKDTYQRQAIEQQTIDTQAKLMQLPLDQVYEMFLKYVLIKTMYWLPWIVLALCVGWVLHGIF